MRYLEIDLARGIAVLLMIAYHFAFDIFFPSPNIYLFAIPIASLFILISGICLHLSYSRRRSFYRFLRRGIKLIILASMITLLSFLFLKKGFIVFGILHFFGLTSFLIYPFLKYFENKLVHLLLGISIILVGIWIWNLEFEFSYLLWLGFIPKNFFSFDYFPLFPWFGVLLLGVFLGKAFYPNGERSFKINLPSLEIIKVLSFLGKHSLVIYFIHQPIIILILNLIGLANVAPFLKL